MARYSDAAFKKCDNRCVYCGKWMLSDFDTFMLAEEDHLLPTKEGGCSDERNIVISCRVCNLLKGSLSAGKDLYESDRADYIQNVRDHIARRRADRIGEFFSWTNGGRVLQGKAE